MKFQEECQINVKVCLSQFRYNLLRSMGLYPLSNNANAVLRITINICSKLLMSISVTSVLCQHVYLCSRGNVMEGLSNGASETAAYTAVLIKIFLFKCRMEQNMEIQNAVENRWKRLYLRGTSRTVFRIIRQTEGSIRKLTYASCFSALVTYAFLTGAPTSADYVNGAAMGTEMPMKIWLPFELNSWTRKLTVHVTQCLVTCYICWTVAAIFNLYVCILTLLAAEFKILKIDFTSFTDDYRRVRTDTIQHENLVSFRFKRNVENHQKLLGMCEYVNESVSPIFLLMFMAVEAVICLSGYEISLDPFRNLQDVSLFLIAIFHIFLYLWCCHQVTFNSRELSEAVYSSEWWKLSGKYRTSLLIVMIRANKPVVLRASKFCSMSLDNFVVLLKTSYTYFALLRTLHAATGAAKE